MMRRSRREIVVLMVKMKRALVGSTVKVMLTVEVMIAR